MAKHSRLPESQVAKLFFYDESVGSKLRHAVKRGKGRHTTYVGKEVPVTRHSCGYCVVSVKGSVYYVHRLIYILTVGEIPQGCKIDHKDLDKGNNLYHNLRLATNSENMCNLPVRKSDGLPKGIRKIRNKFHGEFMKDGVKYTNSSYDPDKLVSWITAKREKVIGEYKRD